jgi:hypothetical protein
VLGIAALQCSGHCRPARRWAAAFVAFAVCTLAVGRLPAAEVSEAEELFNAGKYASCAETAAAEIDGGDFREDWRRLKIKSELAEGKYDAALASAEEAVSNFPGSVELRLLAHTAYL